MKMKNNIFFRFVMTVMISSMLAVIALTSMNVPLQAAIPAQERAALIALYNNTAGDNWTDNSGWKAGTLESDGFGPIGSEGTWYGITVSGDHVTEIDFGNIGNNLTGSLPSELGNLDNLETFSLRENNLTGNIPPELGNLGNLKTLRLGYDLTGRIPPALGNLANLETLDLFSNYLTGSIPPQLGNLGNLKTLKLVCRFTGGIPPELGNLANLETLDIGYDLTGSIPPELGNLGNLVSLILDGNLLSGSIPLDLGNFCTLETLNLSNNLFTGGIPSELGKLSNLRVLNLSENDLSGSIPPEIGNLGSLVWLYLSVNQLTGPIPGELGNLSLLESLGLYNNKLTGPIPMEFGNLTKLSSLFLNGNRLSGRIPSTITNLTNLPDIARLKNIGYNALYTDDDTIRTFLNGVDPDWEQTQTIAPENVSALAVNPYSITVSWTPIYYIAGSGGYNIYRSTSSGGPWEYVGKTGSKTGLSYTVNGLSPGTTYYFVVETWTDAHSGNPNIVLSQYSEETSAATPAGGGSGASPFGEFSTPLDGAVVSSSIPVTGWALDDMGVESVKIYRGNNGNLAYIGDATFVAGARPDVEEAYPDYPNSNKAGWGYMMLTNFLPKGGNGTFTLHAVAFDVEGNQVTLGSKTITVDNANAVKPFGAIDLPVQGGVVSGSSYRNSGWVLTPLPYTVAKDGSTIEVYVDGVFQGNPNYDMYREDINTLFPGYANSDGAWAYFDFDTTAFTNGLHTIFWTAEDNGGNTDGIGSRYFTIQNPAAPAAQGAGEAAARHSGTHCKGSTFVKTPASIPVDYSSPIGIIKGYNRNAVQLKNHADEKGKILVEINELERVVISLNNNGENVSSGYYTGYLAVGDRLTSLPVGSTLDAERGIFYWQPGPGFLGDFRLVFVEIGPDGEINRKDVTVNVGPGY